VLTGELGRTRLRIAALVLGALATGAMVIVGCTSVTQGSAEIDRADAPVYRASVSASIAESADRPNIVLLMADDQGVIRGPAGAGRR